MGTDGSLVFIVYYQLPVFKYTAGVTLAHTKLLVGAKNYAGVGQVKAFVLVAVLTVASTVKVEQSFNMTNDVKTS